MREQHVAMLDHQFKRGAYLSVLVVVQHHGAAGHGVPPSWTKSPSPVSHGASIGRLGEEGFSRKFQVPDNTRLPADLKTWTPSHLLPPPGRLRPPPPTGPPTAGKLAHLLMRRVRIRRQGRWA